jgi:hypothetical protein
MMKFNEIITAPPLALVGPFHRTPQRNLAR